MTTPPFSHLRRRFRELHRSGCFVIPNPWDVGSARYLARLGFEALASTSSGCAWSLGLPDGEVPLDGVLSHLRVLVEATPLPVNADFGHGFGTDEPGVETHVSMAVETGIAGISIEDASGD